VISGPCNDLGLADLTHQVRLHLVNDSSQGSSSPLSSVTGRAAIGLEDQLLIHEEVHLSSSPFLQVVFEWIDCFQLSVSVWSLRETPSSCWVLFWWQPLAPDTPLQAETALYFLQIWLDCRIVIMNARIRDAFGRCVSVQTITWKISYIFFLRGGSYVDWIKISEECTYQKHRSRLRSFFGGRSLRFELSVAGRDFIFNCFICLSHTSITLQITSQWISVWFSFYA